MLTVNRLAATLLLLFTVFNLSLLAQEKAAETRSSPVVTATASAGRVRYVSMGEVQQTRVQVFSVDGAQVFDSGFRAGNTLDWQIGEGSRLADGSYIFLVSVKDFSESLTQKYGTAILEKGEVYLERTNRAGLPQAQGAALDSNKQSEVFTPVDRVGAAGLNRLAEAMTNDGTVAKQNQASTSTTVSTGGVTASATAVGTGTTGKITKWADGAAGVIADSALTEFNGNIGIGTNTPGHPFVVRRNSGSLGVHSLGELFVDRDDRSRSASMIVGTGGTLKWIFGMPANNDGFQVYDLVNNQPRFFVDPNSGNVGVGNITPQSKLDVTGSVKITGDGNGIVFPDGSVQTTATAGSGESINGSTIITAVNSPATTGTINDNRLSGNVPRLNSANTFNADQAVNGNIAATGRVASSIQMIAPSGRFSETVADTLTVDTNTLYVNPVIDRVGIGTTNPQSKLEVAGTVQSSSGGFKFPDGSVQTTAADKAYTTFPWTNNIQLAPRGSSMSRVLELSLPPGTYMLTATIQLENTASFLGSTRLVECQMISEALWFGRLEGAGGAGDQMPVTIHTVQTVTGTGPVVVYCGVLDGGTDRSYVYAKARRLTAIKIGDLVTQ
jgi:hypothetical protein